MRALRKVNRALAAKSLKPTYKDGVTATLSSYSGGCGIEIECDADDTSMPVVVITAPYPDPPPGPWVSWVSIDFPPIAGGGGTAGGGTSGTHMDFNRGPQCDRENEFMDRTMAQVYATKNFVGTQVPIIVTDPYYPDGQWIKIQAYEKQWLWHAPMANRREFRLSMHYMYNVTTGQPHQTKLKNSYEAGCIGFIVPLASG